MTKTYQKKQVKCVKCGAMGTLTLKTSITKGKRYEYFYVQHTDLETYKKKWCYLGKELPSEYQNLIHKTNDEVIHKHSKIYTQPKKVIHNSDVKKNVNDGLCGCSLVWLGLRLPEPITRVQIPAAAPNVAAVTC